MFTSRTRAGMLGGGWAALLLGVLVLAACTDRQLYQAIQNNRQLECQKLPGTQYEECMKQYSQSYESYRRDREALTKEAQ